MIVVDALKFTALISFRCWCIIRIPAVGMGKQFSKFVFLRMLSTFFCGSSGSPPLQLDPRPKITLELIHIVMRNMQHTMPTSTEQHIENITGGGPP